MEVIVADALAEYHSSIHNEQTRYNYDLILSSFLDDLGVAKHAIQPLRTELSSLRSRTNRLDKVGYQEQLKQIEEIKKEILRLQSNAFASRAKKDAKFAFEVIKNWIVQKQAEADAKKKSGNTVKGYLRPIRILCEQNDILLNWKKISTKFGKAQRTGRDKGYKAEQIRKLLNYPDRRVKPIVLTMSSCGCRVGAFDYLNVGDITPIYQVDGAKEKPAGAANSFDEKGSSPSASDTCTFGILRAICSKYASPNIASSEELR